MRNEAKKSIVEANPPVLIDKVVYKLKNTVKTDETAL